VPERFVHPVKRSQECRFAAARADERRYAIGSIEELMESVFLRNKNDLRDLHSHVSAPECRSSLRFNLTGRCREAATEFPINGKAAFIVHDSQRIRGLKMYEPDMSQNQTKSTSPAAMLLMPSS